MTRPRLLIAAVLLAALTLGGATLSAFGPERIALTQADLQERINRELPRQFRSVTVESATIALAEQMAIGAAEAEGDRGTVNLLDGLCDELEKTVWMLHATVAPAAERVTA